LPAAPIFTQANGAPWNRHAWKKPFKAAALGLGLPTAAVFYSLRHSLITELVHDGLDLLTIAQISGTSLRMIERHYGHLTEQQALRALEKLAV
jgi:site-specific recombinase XerD